MSSFVHLNLSINQTIGKGTSTESTNTETLRNISSGDASSKNGTFPTHPGESWDVPRPLHSSAAIWKRKQHRKWWAPENRAGRSVEHCHTTSKDARVENRWKIGWKIEHQWNWKTWNICKAQPMREVATSAHLAVLRIRGTFDVRQRSQTYVLNEELIARSRDWLRPLDSLVNES